MQMTETARMLQLVSGFHVSRALYVAAQLGVADLVDSGQCTSEQISQTTATHAPSLLRVLRVLASVGVFALDREDRIHMTPLASTLLSRTPNSLRGWALGQLGDEHYEAWGALMDSVRTGGVAFEIVFGKSPWQHRAENAASAQAFDEGMSSFLQARSAAVVSAYPFARFRRLVDVAGGDGQLIATLLAAYPTLCGTLFELPHVVEKARRRLDEAGLSSRCNVIGGSIFESIPKDADAYVLSRVIHDWSDEDSRVILRNCRRAASADSTLLLIERVLPEDIDASPLTQALTVSDLNMLVMTGGRERTAAQYGSLLEATSWRMMRVISTVTEISLVEAVPI